MTYCSCLKMYDLKTLILVTLYIHILPDKTHTIKISEIIKTRPGATFAINNRMFLGLQGISKKKFWKWLMLNTHMMIIENCLIGRRRNIFLKNHSFFHNSAHFLFVSVLCRCFLLHFSMFFFPIFWFGHWSDVEFSMPTESFDKFLSSNKRLLRDDMNCVFWFELKRTFQTLWCKCGMIGRSPEKTRPLVTDMKEIINTWIQN